MEPTVHKQIPPGTQVRVEQRIVHRRGAYPAVVEGEVLSHDMEPTGAWPCVHLAQRKRVYRPPVCGQFWCCYIQMKARRHLGLALFC